MPLASARLGDFPTLMPIASPQEVMAAPTLYRKHGCHENFACHAKSRMSGPVDVVQASSAMLGDHSVAGLIDFGERRPDRHLQLREGLLLMIVPRIVL